MEENKIITKSHKKGSTTVQVVKKKQFFGSIKQRIHSGSINYGKLQPKIQSKQTYINPLEDALNWKNKNDDFPFGPVHARNCH